MVRIELDYSSLIGFIYAHNELKNRNGFAKYLGITPQGLDSKLRGRSPFNQREILKVKQDFNLTDEQVGRYFFTPKLRKGNEGE